MKNGNQLQNTFNVVQLKARSFNLSHKSANSSVKHGEKKKEKAYGR